MPAKLDFLMASSSFSKEQSHTPICNMQIKSLTPIFAPPASSMRDKSSSQNLIINYPSFWRASKNCCAGGESDWILKKAELRIEMPVINRGTGEKTGVVPVTSRSTCARKTSSRQLFKQACCWEHGSDPKCSAS